MRRADSAPYPRMAVWPTLTVQTAKRVRRRCSAAEGTGLWNHALSWKAAYPGSGVELGVDVEGTGSKGRG